METWFVGDTHFGHAKMIEQRGVSDEALIEYWNSLIAPKDTVYHLGDFSFHKRDASANIFSALHGQKHLIVGNHDSNHVLQLPWYSVNDMLTVSINKQKFVLCHYPLMVWNNCHHGAFHLHGHSHGQLKAEPTTRLDVGVDSFPFNGPLPVDTIVSILSVRKPPAVDYHQPQQKEG